MLIQALINDPEILILDEPACQFRSQFKN
nr:hypothetical protein [Mycoplasmopsis bovis]